MDTGSPIWMAVFRVGSALIASEFSNPFLYARYKGLALAGLRDNHTQDLVNQPEGLAHLETLEEGVHVAEIAAGDDDVVGHLPVELLRKARSRRFSGPLGGAS